MIQGRNDSKESVNKQKSLRGYGVNKERKKERNKEGNMLENMDTWNKNGSEKHQENKKMEKWYKKEVWIGSLKEFQAHQGLDCHEGRNTSEDIY